MAFDTGTMTFRVFEVEGGIDDSSISGFASCAVPPIDTLLSDPIDGWVGPRHLLDREITEETVLFGNYLHLGTVKAERKVPASLLRAECKMQEIEQMRMRDVRFLNKRERASIRKAVQDALLPTMPPTLTGTPCVVRLTDGFCAAQAMTDKRLDAFLAQFKRATGSSLVQWTPELAALRLRGVAAETLTPACFAPESSTDVKTSPGLGSEFLTWLWYVSDINAGLMPTTGKAQYALSLEGPLVFVVDGDGARTASLRDGNPLESAEAKTSLFSGKKLRSAKLNLAQDDQLWTCTLDALDFSFRALKLPKGDGATPEEIFQDRMEFLKEFLDVFWDLFGVFLKIRADGRKWLKEQKAVQDWVSARAAKA